MARTKEFDPAVALDAAMRLFWARGYEATSTADLVTKTGVARASLYATFGSKRDLYLACLDHYLAGAATSTPEAVVAAHDSGLMAARALLLDSLPTSTQDPLGCFSVNAAVEHGEQDGEIGRRLEANRVRLETALRSALQQARDQGELRDGLDVEASTSMLLVVVTGLRALARSGPDQDRRLRAAIGSTLDQLAA